MGHQPRWFLSWIALELGNDGRDCVLKRICFGNNECTLGRVILDMTHREALNGSWMVCRIQYEHKWTLRPGRHSDQLFIVRVTHPYQSVVR